MPLSWGLEPAWDTLLLAVSSPVTTAAGRADPEPSSPPCDRLAAGRPGCRERVAGDLAQGWGLRAAAEGWPLGQPAEFVASASWLPPGAACGRRAAPLPDGSPARRGSLVLWLSVIGALAAELGWVFNPDAGSEYVAGPNPYAVEWLPTAALFVGGFALVGVAMLAALVAVVIRFRASSGVERLQLKWFALASGALAVTLPLGGALWFVTPIVHVIPASVDALAGRDLCRDPALPALRRRPGHQPDLHLRVLTVLLAAVYAGAVLVLGAVVGRDSVWVTAGATLLAAAAFKLAHRRVQDVIDRRFRPQRHDALSVVTAFVDDLRQDRAEPEDVVEPFARRCATPASICGSSCSPTSRPSTNAAVRSRMPTRSRTESSWSGAAG